MRAPRFGVGPRGPRARRMVWITFVLVGTLDSGAPVSAQRVVPVHEEPRHRLLVSTQALRLLDVQIQPGDTTLFHTHDTPITYVTVGRSSTDQQRLGGAWRGTRPRTPPPGRVGQVRSVLSYADEPLTHRVTNVGDTLFRLIAIATRSEGVAGEPADLASLPGDPGGSSRWFRTASLRLEPGAATTATAAAPTVVVLVEDGRASLAHEDGWVTSLERAGSAHVVDAGRRYTLRAADAPVTLVLVEVR